MLAATHALATVYKWIDDEGSVNYTQYKPTAYEFVEVDPPDPPPSISYDLNEKFAAQIRGSLEDKGKTSPALKKKENTDRKAQQCETAKNNLNVLENMARISYTDETGEKVRMGEDQRTIRTTEAKKNVEFFCN